MPAEIPKNKLIIFGGLPGVGKSTLSKYMARKYQMTYLRIDEIEQAIQRVKKGDVGPEGYGVAYRIALDNLSNGLSVIADSVNPIEITRSDWKKVAQEADTPCIQIEVICSDLVEHQSRIEKRLPEIPHHKLPTWTDVVNRDYETWHGTDIVIDTGIQSLDQSKRQLDIFFDNVK